MRRLTGHRLQTLALIDECCQSHRIAKRLGIRSERAQVHLQWAKRNGLALYDRSRWNVTEAGRAALAQQEKAGADG